MIFLGLWTLLCTSLFPVHLIMFVFNNRFKIIIIWHHTSSLNFSHQNIISCALRIFSLWILILQIWYFSYRIAFNATSKICKKCWRYSPCYFSFTFCFFISLNCIFWNNYFVKSCVNISTSHMFKCDSWL